VRNWCACSPHREVCVRNRFVPYVLFFSCCLTIELFVINGQAGAQDEPGPDSKSIEHVLRKQQDAWNRHDLEGFMAGYWNSSALTFFSGAKERDGWQATMDRYLATYASPGHQMGVLEFSGLRIEVLGQQVAFVRGAWKLTMSDGKTPHGLFTLVFRKFPEGWKIVHDHTSAAE
jgi:ketosteroid isomerase-like protein